MVIQKLCFIITNKQPIYDPLFENPAKVIFCDLLFSTNKIIHCITFCEKITFIYI